MRGLVIGYGEIGKAIYKYYGDSHELEHYDIIDENRPKKPWDILLICFPYSKNFVTQVQYYKEILNTKSCIIFSTVQIGTTKQIKDAIHSPIEGIHPMLEDSLREWDIYVGGKMSQTHKQFFVTTKSRYKNYLNSDTTEFLKLQSTTLYGLNIEFARYVKDVCTKLKINYDAVMDYNVSYNILYRELGESWASRYILAAPKGKIGGHCVLPNSELLNYKFPNELIDYIIRLNASLSKKEGKR